MIKQTKEVIKKKFIRLGGEFDGDELIVWKFVTSTLGSPNRGGGIEYQVGKTIIDKQTPNYNPLNDCGEGLNVHAEQPVKSMVRTYCGRKSMILLECRVKLSDAACIPNAAERWSPTDTAISTYAGRNHYTGGPKFRVKKLEVVASYRYDGKEEKGLKPIEMAKEFEFAE